MERRLGDRIETMAQLHCRIPATPCRAVMVDLSRTGCRLQMPHANFERGSTALLDLPGAPQFPGRVMWASGNVAGIRFQRRMSEALAIALGLAEAPEPVAPEPYHAEEVPGPALPHWIRRLVGMD